MELFPHWFTKHLIPLLLLCNTIQSFPLDNCQHDQRLTIWHRGDGNIFVELEAVTHARTEGHVGDFSIRLDLSETAFDGGIGGLQVLLSRDQALIVSLWPKAGLGQLTIRIPARIPAANPALALVST